MPTEVLHRIETPATADRPAAVLKLERVNGAIEVAVNGVIRASVMYRDGEPFVYVFYHVSPEALEAIGRLVREFAALSRAPASA